MRSSVIARDKATDDMTLVRHRIDYGEEPLTAADRRMADGR